jgi:hypothetical protein
MRKLFADEKFQSTIVLYTTVAPVLALPVYLLAYLGWTMSGGLSATNAKDIIMLLGVPVTCMSVLTILVLAGTPNARKLRGIAVAAALNAIDLALAARILTNA